MTIQTGFRPNNPPPEVVEHRRRMVHKRTLQGRSLTQIAAELGTTKRTVSRIRCTMGIATPLSPKLSPAERAKIEEWLDDGWPYTEIARTLGRSVSTIAQNFPCRSKWEPLGCHHLKMAKSLGLELISGE